MLSHFQSKYPMIAPPDLLNKFLAALFLLITALTPLQAAASGLTSVDDFASDIQQCLQDTEENGTACVSQTLTNSTHTDSNVQSNSFNPKHIVADIESWLGKGFIQGIMSIHTKTIAGGFFVEKKYRIINSNNQMGLALATFYLGDNKYFLKDFIFIKSDKDVINEVCSGCHMGG